jgi:hypothetical protein
MQVKDPDVFGIIERIGEHYKANISNSYLRAALLHMKLEEGTWSLIDSLTERSDYWELQGYRFEELYERILALARFIFYARRDIKPQLRMILTETRSGRGRQSMQSSLDKTLRDMAISNFGSNLSLLSDLLHELYIKTTVIDKKAHGIKPPAHTRIPELKELGKYLVPG